MRKIEFSPPSITDLEIKEVVDALKSGWITTGPKTKQFEKELANYCGTEKFVTLNSATAGMELTLRLLGVGPGDEVITSSYTYTASASVIAHVGAKIVLVDTQKNSPEMDYDALREAITEKTKVIIPVDIAGVMCDYDTIFKIVDEKKNIFNPRNEIQNKFNRVVVMADAAHSFGAKYKSLFSGNVADFSVFSFHAVKNLTTAEGGGVTWKANKIIDSEEIYNNFMLLALHGQTKDALAKTKPGAWEYDIVAPNFKNNLTDIHAAIGLSQLRRYGKMQEQRENLVKKYNELLFENEKVTFINHPMSDTKSSYHLFFVRINGIDEKERNHIISQMANKGISTNVHYKPLPLLSAYKNLNFSIEDYPNSFDYYKNEITLPLHNQMSSEDVVYVVETLLELIQ